MADWNRSAQRFTTASTWASIDCSDAGSLTVAGGTASTPWTEWCTKAAPPLERWSSLKLSIVGLTLLTCRKLEAKMLIQSRDEKRRNTQFMCIREAVIQAHIELGYSREIPELSTKSSDAVMPEAAAVADLPVIPGKVHGVGVARIFVTAAL